MLFIQSGRADLNRRPPRPKRGALTGLRYAPMELSIMRFILNRQGGLVAILLEWPLPEVALLKVQRPEVRNALNWEDMHTFSRLIEDLHTYPSVRAVVLTGAGGAFIAGGDLKELIRSPTFQDGQRLSELMSTALDGLHALPCPTIAAVNGAARGGGAEICLACDLRVFDPQATIGFVQVELGLTPGWGGGLRLAQLVGYSRSLEWLTTGRILSAEEAYTFGLANRLSAPGKSLDSALQLAEEISNKPQETVYAIKRLLRVASIANREAAKGYERAQFPSLWVGQEHIEAVEKFLHKK